MGYMLPAIIHSMNQVTCHLPQSPYHLPSPPQAYLERGDGPIVLVMAPTRELAQQIQEQATKFAGPCQLRCGIMFVILTSITSYSRHARAGRPACSGARPRAARSGTWRGAPRSAWPRRGGS